MYKIKILPDRRLTTLYSVHTLWDRVRNVKSALSWNRFVKRITMKNLPVIKSIREGIICLFSLPSLKYLFSAGILSINETPFQCLLAQGSVSSASASFVLLNFAPNLCARLDGRKMLKLHKLQQIMLVLFEIYMRKLIIRIESMNGITDVHIFVWRATRHTMCTLVIPFIPFMKRPKSTFNS